MRRIVGTGGLALALLALGTAWAAAQTRVDVALGFGAARPYVSGVVEVGSPLVYSAPSAVFVGLAPRPYYFYRRPRFAERRSWAYGRYRGDWRDRGEWRSWGGRHHPRHWGDGDHD